jgi:hypothetical protein
LSPAKAALAAYSIAAVPWTLAGGIGLLRGRRWGWSLAVTYCGLSLLTVVFAPLVAAPFAGLLLPKVRRHFAPSNPTRGAPANAAT